MALTRVRNNQVYNSDINAATKIQAGTITGALLASGLTYTGNLTVGNLTVNGNTTSLDSVSVVTADPTIVLNRNFSGANTYDVGFVLGRGNQTNTAMIWNESNKEFAFIFTSATTGDSYYGTLPNTGYANLRAYGGLFNNTTSTTSSITNLVTGNAKITGGYIDGTAIGSIAANTGAFTTLGATGTSTLAGVTAATVSAGTIGNAGATHTGSTFNATGAVTGNTFTGIAVLAGTIGNTGTTLTGTLSTAAQTNITSVGTLTSLAVSGTLGVSGTSTLGAVTASTLSAGTIGNAGASLQGATGAFTGAVTGNTFTGIAVYAGTIGNTGATHTGSTFNATGAVTGNTFTGVAVLAGTIGNTGANLVGIINTNAQPYITSVGVLSSLGVTGSSTLGAVTASTVSAGTIGNAGASISGGTLGVTGTSTLGAVTASTVSAGTIGNAGASLSGASLGVTGTSTLGAVTAATVSAGTIGNAGASLSGASLGVTGTSTLGAVTASTVSAGTIGNTGASVQGATGAFTGAVTGNTFAGIAVYAGTIGNTGATLTGTLSTAAQTNITSVGTLTSLGVTGTSTLGAVTAATVSAGTIGNAGASLSGGSLGVTGTSTLGAVTAATVSAGTIGNSGASVQGATGAFTSAVTGNTFTGSAVYAGTIGNTGASLIGTIGTATQNSIATMTGLTGFGTAGVTTTAAGNFTIAGNLTVQGNTSTIGSADIVVQDSIINLHTYANLAPWTVNDGRDIGIKFHYFDTADKHAFLGRDNATGFLEFFANGTENASNVFTGGEFGTIKGGALIAANTTVSTSTTTGALQISGGAGIVGAVFANSFNGVSIYAGTIGNTGATLTGTLSTAAQPNVTSLGTLTALGVTGTSTLGAVTAATVSAGTIGNAGASISGGSLGVTGTSTLGAVTAATVSAGTIGNAGASLSGGSLGITGTSTLGAVTASTVSAGTIGNAGASLQGATGAFTGAVTGNTFAGIAVLAGTIGNTGATHTGSTFNATGAVTGNTFSGVAVYAGTIGNTSATLTGATLTTSGVISASGNIVAAATTSSTSTTTGALVVRGGAGIAGDVKIGTSLEVNSGAYGNVTATQYASVWGSGGGSNPYSVMQVRSSDGVSGLGMQAYTGSGVLYGNVIGFVTNATIRDRDVYSGGTLTTYFASNGAIINTTGIASTTTGTGALIVSGGAGISGAVYANSFTGVAVLAGTIGNTGATLTGTLSTAAQTNVTSLGTLTALGVTGTSTLGAVTAATVSAGTIGNAGASLQGATGAFTGAVTGNTFAGIAVLAGTIGNTGTTLTGTLSTAAQTNVTSLGTLTGLTVSGTLTNSSTTDATSSTAAGAIFSGGIAVAKSANIGGNIYSASTGTFVGNVIAPWHVGTTGLAGPIVDIDTITPYVTSNVNFDIPLNGNVVVNSSGRTANLVVQGNTTSGYQNLLVTNGATGQVGIKIAPNAIQPGTSFYINATDSMVLPVGATGARPSAGQVTKGMLRFNNSTNLVEFWDGSAWNTGGAVFTTITSDSFTGDGSTTAFTLSTTSTTAGTIVMINGVVQIPTAAYSVSGSTLTFTEAPLSTDIIDARAILTTSAVTTIADGTTAITVANTAGVIYNTVQGTNVYVATRTLTTMTGNLIPSANVTYNIGSTTANWNNVYAVNFSGTSTTAKYADLAEKYVADATYESGTVLEFGGENEVTLSTTDASPCIAGVVTTDPAYLMNSHLEAEHVAAVALTGRVPTKIIGPVSKGQMMVSAGNGRARAETNPAMGSVIGKALENFGEGEGIIEVVVGRI